jgi:hypothetical protein
VPDANKFDVLRQVGYSIPINCGTCAHGQFKQPRPFGTCAHHQYEHGKHTGPERGVSVHVDGTCPDAARDPAKVASKGYGAHEEFVP